MSSAEKKNPGAKNHKNLTEKAECSSNKNAAEKASAGASNNGKARQNDGTVKINIAAGGAPQDHKEAAQGSRNPEDQDKESAASVIGVLKISRTEQTATGTTSKTTTYNIKSDGSREKVETQLTGCDFGSERNCAMDKQSGLNATLGVIEAENPAQIIVGGHPYFSEKYVAEAQASAARDVTPSFHEIVAGLLRVQELADSAKRQRNRDIAKKMARVTAKVLMWMIALGLVYFAGVGIYALATHAFN